jgi:hypothetical protein
MMRAGAGVAGRRRRRSSDAARRDLERKGRDEFMMNSAGAEMDLKTRGFRRAMGVAGSVQNLN